MQLCIQHVAENRAWHFWRMTPPMKDRMQRIREVRRFTEEARKSQQRELQEGLSLILGWCELSNSLNQHVRGLDNQVESPCLKSIRGSLQNFELLLATWTQAFGPTWMYINHERPYYLYFHWYNYFQIWSLSIDMQFLRVYEVPAIMWEKLQQHVSFFNIGFEP